MTDPILPSDSSENAPAGPNLMVLKGIVVGLGVLLVLGMILIAVKITTGIDETAATVSANASFSDLPPLPLGEGETIHSVTALQGRLVVLVENASGERNIITIVPPNGTWVELSTTAKE